MDVMFCLCFHGVHFVRTGREAIRWLPTILAGVALVVVSLGGGCGAEHGFSYGGEPGQVAQATLVAWAPAVQTTIVASDDVSPIQGLFLLDTGSPISAVDLGFLA